MGKFKKGDIIEWEGCIGRIEHIHKDVAEYKKYIIKWLKDNAELGVNEKLIGEAEITFADNNAKLASENYQILYGKI